MTNIIQPNDAGLGRSVRILIGHFLDAWLMEVDHMEKWESNMTAGERRILSIGFLGKAMRKVMTHEYEAMRVGCFERTECLLTLIANNEHDKRIKPQEMMAGSFAVPTQSVAVGGDNEDDDIDIVVQPAEEAALAEEQARIDDNEDDGELEMENEGKNGDHDDHD